MLDLCAQGNGARIEGLELDPLLCSPYWTLALLPTEAVPFAVIVFPRGLSMNYAHL